MLDEVSDLRENDRFISSFQSSIFITLAPVLVHEGSTDWKGRAPGGAQRTPRKLSIGLVVTNSPPSLFAGYFEAPVELEVFRSRCCRCFRCSALSIIRSACLAYAWLLHFGILLQ